MSILATLIMNWNEDGIVYKKRHDLDGEPVNLGLNPLIRGFRLAFIILFTLTDVGSALYKVSLLG